MTSAGFLGDNEFYVLSGDEQSLRRTVSNTFILPFDLFPVIVEILQGLYH